MSENVYTHWHKERRGFRWWVKFFQWDFTFELALFFSLGLRLLLEPEETGIQLRVSLIFVTMWVSLSSPQIYKALERILPSRECIATWDDGKVFYLTDSREFGLIISAGMLEWSFFHDDNSGTWQEPWWRNWVYVWKY